MNLRLDVAKKKAFWAFLIFVAALALRLVFIHQWYAKTPYGSLPLLDAKAYDDWASEILAGHFLRSRAFYQSPFYPYFLALIYKLGSHSSWIVSVIQSILGAATCVILFEITWICGGLVPAVVAGFLAAFDGSLIFFTAPLMKETLGVLFLALSLFFLLRSRNKESMAAEFAAGFFLGVTALLRGNVLILAAALVVYGLCRREKRRLIGALVLAGAFALPVLPCTVHNWLASRDFVLINYTGGFDFYMGNYPGATGANSYPSDVSSEPGQEEADTTRIAETVTGRPLRPSEISRFWMATAVQFMIHHPLSEARLFFRKVWIFWNHYEQPDNYDQNFVAGHFATVLRGPLVTFGLITILAALGVLWTWKVNSENRFLAVLGLIYSFAVILFYVTDRYRLPEVVFLIPLAGAGLQQIYLRLRTKNILALVKGLAIISPVLILTASPAPADLPGLEGFDWGQLAALNSDLGRDQEAVAALEKSLAINPAAARSEAYVKGAMAEERLGQWDKADQFFKSAMGLYSRDPTTFYNYALFKYRRGHGDEALKWLEKSFQVAPWHVEPLRAQALIQAQQGQIQKARETWEKVLRLNPGDAQAQDFLKKMSVNGTK